MDEIKEFKKELDSKINSLEYKRIAPMEKEIKDIQIALGRNNLLTEQNIISNEKTVKAMEDISKSMNNLFLMTEKNIETAEANTKAIQTINTNIEQTSKETKEEIKMLNIKIEEVDDKTKIDTSIITKQHYQEILNKVLGVIGILGILGSFIINFKK